MRARSRGFAPLGAALVLLSGPAAPAAPPDRAKDAPAHGRPYFLPAAERQRLRGLIKTEEWAKKDHARLKEAAGKGDGHAAAFLYALDGDARHIPTATKWLLEKYGPRAYWIDIAARRLADPGFFKAGQPGIPEVYYDTDLAGLVAFDWAHDGLAEKDRAVIREGLLTWARYKMRCMDRWTQTPNLVLKPTFTVALTGLATRDRQCLEWGFHRTKPWGRHIGGYFEVLDAMLKDGGPWHEAPIYPGAHTGLLVGALMSRYRGLYDGKDWWNHKTPGGGSPRGLMDYYLDSAYPFERTGPNAFQVRVANYGDGSTNGAGDLFLVSPANRPGDVLLHEPLAAAYNVSADPRYAAFLARVPGYKPDLWERRPLPAKTELPPAPSKVWPKYGLAMLRSDESPAYWTSGKALAVFQLMTRGYGHDHRDKFSITLHGAGRLLYPDYNAIQYENLAVGWTRNTVAHNTMVVDEHDTRDAEPTGLRHSFTPEVKFLATSADGVFEGVAQTRALFLTREYLLDVFAASSVVPHTYDYLLHGFGEARPARPDAFAPSAALRRRYWLLDDVRARTTAESWSLDFTQQEKSGSRKGEYGKEWYGHTANVRVTMAGGAETLAAHGVWGKELARLVVERNKNARLDPLSTLAARRAGVRDTTFVVTHEPYANAERPKVRAVTTLLRTAGVVLARVEADDFTDYVAVDLGPRGDAAHVVRAGGMTAAFKNYGYLRVARGGVTARGGWQGFRLPKAKGPLTLDGKAAATEQADDGLEYNVPRGLEGREARPDDLPECPFPVTVAPPAVRVFDRDRRAVTFTVKNTLAEEVAGGLAFDLPKGVGVDPKEPAFGPLKPGAAAVVKVTFVTDRAAAGGTRCRTASSTRGAAATRKSAPGRSASRWW